VAARWPDFFIVGAPRCATTAMYEFLRRHPQVFMPWKKEPHFFGADLVPQRHYVRDEREYLALFAEAGDGRRAGEASVWYLASRSAAAEIKRAVPDARIIVQLRDPVDVLYSLHGLRVLSGYEDIWDFEAALAAEPDRAAGRRPWPSRLPLYRETVRFADQVARLFAVFGRQAVHVIIYDDLRRDATAVAAEALRFLGVEPVAPAGFPVVNPSGLPRIRGFPRTLRRLPGLMALGRLVVPTRHRVAVWRRLRKLNMRATPRPPLAPSVRERLQAELRDEVARLEDLLGRDLARWRGP
jgi:hypothetical protein